MIHRSVLTGKKHSFENGEGRRTGLKISGKAANVQKKTSERHMWRDFGVIIAIALPAV